MLAWMADQGNAGRRPWAWWQFDAQSKRDYTRHPNEHDYLAEYSLLEPWEYAAIDAQWHEWFGRKYFENVDSNS